MRQAFRLSQSKKGQAAVEYVLLVLVVVVVFGFLFQQIRQDLFQLWVCEIGPRVQSPIPCKDREDCFKIIADTLKGANSIQDQRALCSQ
jgi:hypothetical protein